MINNYVTNLAGGFSILQSSLLLAWDAFFLFVCYQPLVYTDYMNKWLSYFYMQVEGVQYGINAVVILNTILNFVWLLSSVGALLSNRFSKSNASGIRAWIGVTMAIIFTDVALTLFVIFSSTVTFEDLFRTEKRFFNNFNSTFVESRVVNGTTVVLNTFDKDVAYKGYTLFLAGISRFFFIGVLINIPLVYFASQRVREIRLTTSTTKKQRLSKASSSFFDNLAFADSKPTPNMYADNQITNEYQEPAEIEKWVEPPLAKKVDPVTGVIHNRFRTSKPPDFVIHEDPKERRISVRNYDLNIDAVPRANAIPQNQFNGSLPNTPALRSNFMISKLYPDMPEIPDVDYDDVPDTPPRTPSPPRIMSNGYHNQIHNMANNPLYATINKPNQRSPMLSSFPRPMNGQNGTIPESFNYDGHRSANPGGHGRY